jgi:DNA-binding transcriptional MerR regulator
MMAATLTGETSLRCCILETVTTIGGKEVRKMKIGEMANFCGVSPHTIRYYASLGLLTPRRRNNQYSFSDKDVDDLLYIQKLKDWQFSLRDVESVMRLRRTSNWVEPSSIGEFSLMLRSKRNELRKQQALLQSSIDMIDKELDRLSRRKALRRSHTGVPLKALLHLACPECHQRLQAEQASLSSKYIHNGMLTCACGYSASIDRGIVDTGNRYTNLFDKPDLDRELYRTLCGGLMRVYQKCSAYIYDQLSALPLSGKVVLEANVNGYFFLYNHFGEMPKDCLYVIVDKYPETIFMYKELIEQLGLDLDILYIADATQRYPLEYGCVDVCVDFFSTTEYQFYHEDNYIHAIAPFLAKEASIVGSCIDLDPWAKSRKLVKQKYPESSSRAYTFSDVLQEMKAQGFRVRTDMAGALSKTQDKFSFACHLEGEEMRFHTFNAVRSS